MADQKPSVPFTNVSAAHLQIGGVAIIPGATEHIPGEHVDAVRKSPAVRGGILREGVVAMPPALSSQGPATLRELDEIKAGAQIRLCSDLRKLTEWAQTDDRKSILDAISVRATVLAAQAPAKSG